MHHITANCYLIHGSCHISRVGPVSTPSRKKKTRWFPFLNVLSIVTRKTLGTYIPTTPTKSVEPTTTLNLQSTPFHKNKALATAPS